MATVSLSERTLRTVEEMQVARLLGNRVLLWGPAETWLSTVAPGTVGALDSPMRAVRRLRGKLSMDCLARSRIELECFVRCSRQNKCHLAGLYCPMLDTRLGTWTLHQPYAACVSHTYYSFLLPVSAAQMILRPGFLHHHQTFSERVPLPGSLISHALP